MYVLVDIFRTLLLRPLLRSCFLLSSFLLIPVVSLFSLFLFTQTHIVCFISLLPTSVLLLLLFCLPPILPPFLPLSLSSFPSLFLLVIPFADRGLCLRSNLKTQQHKRNRIKCSVLLCTTNENRWKNSYAACGDRTCGLFSQRCLLCVCFFSLLSFFLLFRDNSAH